jgi:hypothetical protein
MFKKSVASSKKRSGQEKSGEGAKGLAEGKRWKMDTESKCLHWTRPAEERRELCLYDGSEKCFSINFPSFEPFRWN